MKKTLKAIFLAGVLAAILTISAGTETQAHKDPWIVNDKIQELDESINGFRGLKRNLNNLCEEIKTLKAAIEVMQEQIAKLEKRTGESSPFRVSKISSAGIHCSQW